MLNIPKDFREFIQLLNENDVKYLIVGGYAVGYHGHPRSTGDIDIFISTEIKNAKAILNCLKKFGFGQLGISTNDLTEKEQVIQLGYPPLRIDILTSIDGIKFSEAWNNRITEKIDDLSLSFISLKDLLINKKSSNRLKDLTDFEELNPG